MLGIRADVMIVLDDSIEDPGEVLVAIAISSVDTAVLVVEFNSICNSLDEGESGGFDLDSLEFIPHILGDIPAISCWL